VFYVVVLLCITYPFFTFLSIYITTDVQLHLTTQNKRIRWWWFHVYFADFLSSAAAAEVDIEWQSDFPSVFRCLKLCRIAGIRHQPQWYV